MCIVYDFDTVTVNRAQFWFRRFRSSQFDVKDALWCGWVIAEIIVKTTDSRIFIRALLAQKPSIAQ